MNKVSTGYQQVQTRPGRTEANVFRERNNMHQLNEQHQSAKRSMFGITTFAFSPC